MNTAPAPNASGATVPDNRDYLDKALDAVEKKFGGERFADPNKNRAMNEKITDFIRKMIEKVTGYVISLHIFSSAESWFSDIGLVDGRLLLLLLLSAMLIVDTCRLGRRYRPNSPIELCVME